jgi:hypothetical protein
MRLSARARRKPTLVDLLSMRLAPALRAAYGGKARSTGRADALLEAGGSDDSPGTSSYTVIINAVTATASL